MNYNFLASNVVKVVFVGKKIYNENVKETRFFTIKNSELDNLFFEYINELKSYADTFDLYVEECEFLDDRGRKTDLMELF